MSDIVERLRNSPPREICEHGSQKVKCPHCDNEQLEIENEKLRESLSGMVDQHRRDSAELRELCAARDEARRARDALQSKIASASVIVYGRDCDCASESGGIHEPLIGKRVALVPLD